MALSVVCEHAGFSPHLPTLSAIIQWTLSTWWAEMTPQSLICMCLSEMSIVSDVLWPFVFTHSMDFLCSSLPTAVEVVRDGQVLDIIKGKPWVRVRKREGGVEGDSRLSGLSH